MNLENKKKNRKGMTLVEVVIAMSLFSITSLMICMSLISCVKQTSDNYKRSKDVNAESVYVETYDPTKSYTAKSIKVQKNNIAKDGSNNVTLSADFGGGIKFETSNVNCYKSKLPKNKEDAKFQMQFFQNHTNLNSLADPDKGYYYIVFYNDSSSDLDSPGDFDVEIPDTGLNNTYMFDENGQKSTGNTSSAIVLADSNYAIGVKVDSSQPYYITLKGLTIKASTIDHYAEVDSDGNKTGMVYIHYDGTNYLNQNEFDNKYNGINGSDETETPVVS